MRGFLASSGTLTVLGSWGFDTDSTNYYQSDSGMELHGWSNGGLIDGIYGALLELKQRGLTVSLGLVCIR